MTKLATIDELKSKPHGIGWMESWTAEEAEAGKTDLCSCAWVDGYILMTDGNIFCLEDSKENYNRTADGWGFRIWINSKPSARQMKEVPWEKGEAS